MNTPRNSPEKHIPSFSQVYDICIIDYKKMRGEYNNLTTEEFLKEVFIGHIKNICKNNNISFSSFFTQAKERQLLNFKHEIYKRGISEYRASGGNFIPNQIITDLQNENYDSFQQRVIEKKSDKIAQEVRAATKRQVLSAMEKERTYLKFKKNGGNAFNQDEVFRQNQIIADKKRKAEHEAKKEAQRLRQSEHFSEQGLLADTDILDTFGEAVAVENLSSKLENSNNLTEQELQDIEKEKELLANSGIDIDALMFDDSETEVSNEVEPLTEELKAKLESIADDMIIEHKNGKFFYNYNHFVEVLEKTKDSNNSREISEEIIDYFIDQYLTKLSNLTFENYLKHISFKTIEEFSKWYSGTDKLTQDDKYFKGFLDLFFTELSEYAVESGAILTTNYQKANFIINTKQGDNSNVVDHTTQVLFSKHYMLAKKRKSNK